MGGGQKDTLVGIEMQKRALMIDLEITIEETYQELD